jgi:hypothetical protein
MVELTAPIPGNGGGLPGLDELGDFLGAWGGRALGTAICGPPCGIALGGIGKRYGGDVLRGGVEALSGILGRANEGVEAQTQESEAVKTCADCGEVECFEPPAGSTPEEIEEFRQQLQMQEDAINSMDPEEFLTNMDNFDKVGRLADGAARAAAREDYFDDLVELLSNEHIANGMGSEAAEGLAEDEAGLVTSTMDALHAPDSVAGGDGRIPTLGNRSNNRSIGRQWKLPGSSGGASRREQLRRNAQNAKDQGANRMNVTLEVCEPEGGDGGQPEQPVRPVMPVNPVTPVDPGFIGPPAPGDGDSDGYLAS